MQTVDANVGKMEGELRRWAAKLGELRLRGHTVGGELNLDYHLRLDALEAKYDAAETKLDELKASGSDGWETFRSGIESAWGELEAAFRKLTN